MQNNANNILQQLKSLISPLMDLCEPHISGTHDALHYYPDAVLSYKKKQFCLVEIKKTTFRNDLFYLKSLKMRMVQYCQSKKLSYILLVINDHAYLLKKEDGFEIHNAAPLKQVIDGLNSRMSEIQEEVKNLGQRFLQTLSDIADSTCDLNEKTKFRLKRLTLKDCDWQNTDVSIPSMILSSKLELALFQALLGIYDNNQICRYTTRESLFRILSTEKQSLCSIVGMNDKSECNYVDNYFAKISNVALNQSTAIDSHSNNYYITSCTRMDLDDSIKPEDNLSMWRMYADDCKGVCMVFNINSGIMRSGRYIFAPVSYAQRIKQYAPSSYDENGEPIYEIIGCEKKHPELDFLYQLLSTKVGGYDICLPGLDFWKHFFKDVEYKDENEVRLLYKGARNDSQKWIQANNIFCPIVEKNIKSDNNEFPLILEKIILGPKFAEQKVNLVQIEQMISESNIIGSVSIECVPSEIDNYR